MRRAIITPTANTELRAHNPRQSGYRAARGMIATSEAKTAPARGHPGAPSFQNTLDQMSSTRGDFHESKPFQKNQRRFFKLLSSSFLSTATSLRTPSMISSYR